MTQLRPNALFLLLLLAYFALQVVLRVQLSPTLDYDEAEQALFAQWLLPGYSEQPPLFTWIQAGFFALFGDNALAVSLMKNGLLFLTWLFVYLSGLRLLRDDRTAMLATLSLVMIPQIGWESQRDMTHTVLVVCAAAATLLAVLRLVERQSLGNTLLLGLCLATGVLGKANYALFVAVLVLTLLTTAEGRRALLHRYTPLALLLALLLCGEYLHWMTQNHDIVFASTGKFKMARSHSYLRGSLSMVRAIIYFLFPFWLFFVALFPAALRSADEAQTGFARRFSSRYLLIFVVLLLSVVLTFKVTYVKDRWLQPILFCAPLLLFARLEAEQVRRRFRLFFAIGLAGMVVIYSAFTLRIVVGVNGRFSRMNYPFHVMADELRQAGFDGGLILSDKRFLAGNMRLLFPGSTALIPGYHFEEKQPLPVHEKVVLLWMPKEGRKMSDTLRRLALKLGVDMAQMKVLTLRRPQLYARRPQQEVVLGAAIGERSATTGRGD